MFTDRLTEDLHHQIRTAVDDLGLVGEPRRRVDHPQHLYDSLHLVKTSERRAGCRQQIETGRTSSLIALVKRQISAYFPSGVRRCGTCAGEKEEAANAYGWDVVGDRRGRRRQADVLLLEVLFSAPEGLRPDACRHDKGNDQRSRQYTHRISSCSGERDLAHLPPQVFIDLPVSRRICPSNVGAKGRPARGASPSASC